jgi:phosphoglycolate phosphatase-like HAD superfamily hydrolase
VAQVTAMLDADRDRLLDEIREVYRLHKTVEYAFVLQNTPTVSNIKDLGLRQAVIDAGREAFVSARRANQRLYPGVRETLEAIKESGAAVVGLTESQQFYTEQRLRMFGLDGVLDALYSTREHIVPADEELRAVRRKPDPEYLLRSTRSVVLRQGLQKPDPEIVASILTTMDAAPDKTVYVGDSLVKDILMAQRAGVHDVYAAYGSSVGRPENSLLQRVTHWTDAEIEQQDRIAASVQPSITIRTFAEILDLFYFNRQISSSPSGPVAHD